MKYPATLLAIILIHSISFSQNVGIGTNAPSAQLDISGSFRYRGNGFPNIPRMGSLLTAIDDKGNAEWQRPIVFKTKGLPAQQSISKGVWTKILFKNNEMEINEGLAFDPFTSTFNAPVKGAYHFDAQIMSRLSSATTEVRIVVERNGSIVKEYRSRIAACDICNADFDDVRSILSAFQSRSFTVSTMIALEKYDKVWVEAIISVNDSYMTVKPGMHETWFCGALLYRL